MQVVTLLILMCWGRRKASLIPLGASAVLTYDSLARCMHIRKKGKAAHSRNLPSIQTGQQPTIELSKGHTDPCVALLITWQRCGKRHCTRQGKTEVKPTRLLCSCWLYWGTAPAFSWARSKTAAQLAMHPGEMLGPLRGSTVLQRWPCSVSSH